MKLSAPSLITEAKLLEAMERGNRLLERLCLAVEGLIPPPPDTEVTVDYVDEMSEGDDRDESAGLEDYEAEQQREYEDGILAMNDEDYERFVRTTGSDPRKRIRKARRKAGTNGNQGKG